MSQRTLDIAEGLSLPLEAVTRRLAILGMSGAGKSNVAVVLAEQMFDAGIPWVAIDPKGDWWGIRSSVSGKGPGLPIPIFGGLHGDIPLEPTAGAYIGELIAEQRLTCLLDISEFAERQDMWRFLTDLGNALLRRNRQALHLFLEEADEYIPQTAKEGGNLSKCLGVWQRVVKRGRFRGIGSTQISQRNAAVNKDTLYMAEVLIAMRATGKGDRNAVAGWVEHHNAAAEIVASLPTLADGEGWVSSPAWLRQTARVRFNRRRTFDSGSTPVLLAGKAPAATLADVDLAAISVRMAETIERAKENDPAELKHRLAAAKAELDRLRAAKAKGQPDPERIDKLQERARLAERTAKELGSLLTSLHRKLGALQRRLETAQERNHGEHADILNALAALESEAEQIPSPVLSSDEIGERMRERAEERSATRSAAVPRHVDSPAGGNGRSSAEATSSLPMGEFRVLTAIAQHQRSGASRVQLTIVTGYKKSTLNLYIQRLRQQELAETRDDGLLFPTSAGIDALGPNFQPLPTGRALLEHWLRELPEGERRVLSAAVAVHPRGIHRGDLQEQAGYMKSTLNLYIQRLKARRLLADAGRGEVRAAAELF